MTATAAKHLVLVRHAKSSWELDVEDPDRPLSGRGRRDARAVGDLLIERGLEPDLVLCSTATRTRQTWAGAAATGADAGEVTYDAAIYHAWVPELVSLIRSVPETVSTLLMLGHAPGIPDLVEHLAVREHESEMWSRLDTKFPTAAMAVLEVTGPWSGVGKGRARLLSFDVARARS